MRPKITNNLFQFTFVILLLILIAFLSNACSSSKSSSLSKEEAQKQIDKSHEDAFATRLILRKQTALFSGSSDPEQNALQLATNTVDYVDFKRNDMTKEIDRSSWIEDYTVLPKAKPYYKEMNGSEWLTFGALQAQISYITEPAPDASGQMVCKVHYVDSLVLNPLGKDINPIYSHRGEEQTATFVKTQDGWKLTKADN